MDFFLAILILFFSCSLQQSYSENTNTERLQLVQILMRHGEKNPGKTYPNDPYRNDSNWPGGFDQLTDEGKLRMYNIGKYLREQYDGVIGITYKPKDIYVLSSDYDRTIRSAMSLLAGLYKESNLNSTWNSDNITWNPVPVHTIAKEHDRVFETTESCSKLKEIFNFVFNDSDYAQMVFSDENKETQNFLSENAGVDFSQDLHYLSYIFDTLVTERDQFNLELPSWADSLLNSDIIGNVPNNIYIKTFNSRVDWLRLRVGPLLSDIISNMDDVVAGVQDARVMRLWMSHETSLSAFIAALNLYNQINLPVYGSSIILELHKGSHQENSSFEYFVQVYIKNDTTINNPTRMAIPECPSPCSLENFKTFAQKFIPEDWETECQEKMELNTAPLSAQVENTDTSNKKTGSYFATSVLLIATMFACLSTVIYIYRRQKNLKMSLYEKL